MDDLSFLVEETFNHLKSVTTESHQDLDKKSGLIYHVEIYPSIFVIRSLATKDLKLTLLDIKKYPENYPSLKISNQQVDKVNYFQTESYEDSQTLMKLTANKRFPIHEELMCSFSDPSFSYWLSQTPKGISISTKIRSVGMGEMIRLGDFGDFLIFKSMILNLHPLLSLLPSNQWRVYAQDHRINFEGDKNHFLWDLILKFFNDGELNPDFIETIKFLNLKLLKHENDFQIIMSYLREISMMRKFWVVVFNQLKDVGSSRTDLAM